MSRSSPRLLDVEIPPRLKLSALWTAVMLCYIYGDIFGFFEPGTLQDIVAGRTGVLGTQTGLLAAALLMAIPSLMVALTLLLAPKVSRAINIIFGVLYTMVILATLPGAWWFYVCLGIIEAGLTLSIVWHAWRWPSLQESSHAPP